MRIVKFKMERPGQVKTGDMVTVSEKKTALNYSYIIEPSVAMSGCYKVSKRLQGREGVVRKVIHNARGYYVFVEFEEEEVDSAVLEEMNAGEDVG